MSDEQTTQTNDLDFEVATDEIERAFLKDHRSILIKMYTSSWDQLSLYDNIKQSIIEENRRLMSEIIPDNPIQRYRKAVIDAKMCIFEAELKGIRDDIDRYNTHVSQEIMRLNIKLGWDVDELCEDHDNITSSESENDSDNESDDDKSITSQNLEGLSNELPEDYKFFSMDNLSEKYGFTTPDEEDDETPDISKGFGIII